jgi:type IV secretory pathway ATPase VirB11/archaellum biosynthesis ATPase
MEGRLVLSLKLINYVITKEIDNMNQNAPFLTSKLAVPLTSRIHAAFRLQPKRIAVGEVRGEEAKAFVEAMETGTRFIKLKNKRR